MSEVVLTKTEREAIRAVCDDARQFDEVLTEVETIIAARMTAAGMTENHEGPHTCFPCGMTRAMKPIVEMVKASRARSGWQPPRDYGTHPLAAPSSEPTP